MAPGDKTNEPGSLKKRLSGLLTAYPALQLLTGDAIYAQRPLLELVQEHGCDYLFQVQRTADADGVTDGVRLSLYTLLWRTFAKQSR